MLISDNPTLSPSLLSSLSSISSYIGIDPSIRHTGIVILSIENSTTITNLSYSEIKSGTLPLLESGLKTRQEFKDLVLSHPNSVFGIEKMIPRALCGPELFYIQMLLLEVLNEHRPLALVHPLPLQLKSYFRTRFSSTPRSKSDIVRLFKTVSGVTQRVSSHVADAYFLARLAKDVMEGMYKYNLSEKETTLMLWSAVDGK